MLVVAIRHSRVKYLTHSKLRKGTDLKKFFAEKLMMLVEPLLLHRLAEDSHPWNDMAGSHSALGITRESPKPGLKNRSAFDRKYA